MSTLTVSKDFNSMSPSSIFKMYVLPHLLGYYIATSYIIIDGIIVGRFLGANALAAITVIVPVFELILAIGMLISVGASIPISQSLGRGDEHSARKIFNEACIIKAIISVIIMVGGNIYAKEISYYLGATEEIIDLSTLYLKWFAGTSPILLFGYSLGTYIRNDKRPHLAMISLAIGSIVNIVSDLLFVIVFDMGLIGVALASAVGSSVTILILMPHFVKKLGVLYFEKVTLHKKNFIDILRYGFPIFFTEFSIGLVTLIYNKELSIRFGVIGITTYAIIGYIALLVLTTFLGIGSGVQPAVSYFYGSENKKGIISLYKFSAIVSILSGIIFYIIILIFAKYCIDLFIHEKIEGLHEFSINAINLYFIGFMLAGINIATLSFFTSMSKDKIAFVLSLGRGFILIAIFIKILPYVFGDNGVWLSVTFSEVVMFILTLPMIYSIFFKNK